MLDRARAVAAEVEVRTFDHTDCVELAQHHGLKEVFRRQIQQSQIRRVNDHAVDTASFDQFSFLLKRCQCRRAMLWSQELNRVRLEGEYARGNIVLFGVTNQAGEHLLMPAVYAIKVSNRQVTAAERVQ